MLAFNALEFCQLIPQSQMREVSYGVLIFGIIYVLHDQVTLLARRPGLENASAGRLFELEIIHDLLRRHISSEPAPFSFLLGIFFHGEGFSR